MMRMTGCPNGCARPYMAELALVGDGPDMYQLWAGGSPILTRISHTIANKVLLLLLLLLLLLILLLLLPLLLLSKVKWSEMDNTIEPLLVHWRDHRNPKEAFGDFVHRIGVEKVQALLPAAPVVAKPVASAVEAVATTTSTTTKPGPFTKGPGKKRTGKLKGRRRG